MALFDDLVGQLDGKFGLGAQARPLIGEMLHLVTTGPGGITGFLDRFRAAGLGSDIASWVGGSGETAMPAQSIERALGGPVISGIAGRLGLGSAAVGTALGFAIPKVIGLLTPGGRIPTTMPPEVSSFLRPAAQFAPHVSEPAVLRTAAPAHRIPEQVAPVTMTVIHDQPHMMRWLWPVLGGLAIVGLAAYFLSGRNPAPVAPVALQTPALPPAAPAPTLPPRLALSNDDGVIHYSGSVHDEDTRTSIINSLNAVFGADKVQGNIGIDLNRGAAPWLVNFREALETLKVPGMQTVFDGNSVNLGGLIGDADRDRITASLQNVLGNGLVYGVLTDQVADFVAGANTKVDTALTSLKTGFTANDLVAILNQSVINFPTGSADLPAASASLMHDAAVKIKQLSPGIVLEVAGYTDNVGDPAGNMTLSQQRADSVRNALIQNGVSPSMLVAKGYGSSNPIASNDLLAGRFRNRRIEYHVLTS